MPTTTSAAGHAAAFRKAVTKSGVDAIEDWERVTRVDAAVINASPDGAEFRFSDDSVLQYDELDQSVKVLKGVALREALERIV